MEPVAKSWEAMVVAAVMALSTLALWAPFTGDASILQRYWDGPHYAYLAKTLYDVPDNHPFLPYSLTPSYWALHFPLYPIVIRAIVPITRGDYPGAMLLATLLTSVVAAVLFHRLLVEWRLVSSPLWTGVLFAFLPPRWILYHSVGATEPLFLCFVLAAFLALGRGRPGWVTLFVAAACLTRIHGALLIPVMALTYLGRREVRSALVVSTAGFTIVALFGFYHLAYGDFLVYFHQQVGERGLLHRSPFDLVRALAHGADAARTEHLVGMFLLYGAGTAALWPHRPLFLYAAAFLGLNVFVFHDDLARYFLPLAPFALLVAYDPLLSRRAVRAVVLPAAIYLGYVYAWGFLPHNLVVPAVWADLLKALAP